MRETRGTKATRKGVARLAGIGSAGAAIGIMVMMLLVPVTGATSIPLKKFGASTYYSVGQAGCTKSKQLVAPHWSGTTFVAAGKSTAPKCRPGPSGNSGDWDAQLGLSTLVHFKTGGNHTINVAWSIAMASSWTATPYTSCILNYAVPLSECVTSAEIEVFGYAYMYDPANSSYFNFGTYVDLFNYTTVQNYSQNYAGHHYGGNYSFGGGSGTKTGTFLQNSTISATGTYAVNNVDQYELYIVLFAETFVSAYATGAVGLGGASASATLDMGTLGHGATLTGVTVS